MRHARITPLLALLAACSSSNLGGAPVPCPTGSVDAATAEASAEAASEAAMEAAPEAETEAAIDSSVEATLGPEASTTCNDGIKDGDETGVDCGGGCGPCGIGGACLVNGDCGTTPGCDSKNGCACDAVSMTCVFDHCFDHKKDGSESDVDCGDPLAPCQGCAVGLKCRDDSDCASRACDGASFSCVQAQCADHQRDGLETDVDCGGGLCATCIGGQGCRVNSDCMTGACDLLSLLCVTDPCMDHRIDGTETDDDCGGPVCAARCGPSQHCGSNFDCVPGHFCNGLHVCQ